MFENMLQRVDENRESCDLVLERQKLSQDVVSKGFCVEKGLVWRLKEGDGTFK